jgi:hypothetical protein
MRQIARHEYSQRTAELERRYAERIARAEGDKDKLFANTLARLERFLQDHPAFFRDTSLRRDVVL